MPHNPIRFITNFTNIPLENFFGFALAKITSPPNIKIPLLIHRYEGKVIHPTGTWVGVYFSEELKAMQKHGYKIELIKGIEFTKEILFKDYIDHFYAIKKNATGPLRWIAKMHLNTLYGIFGRKKDTLETITVNNEDIPKIFLLKVVKSIVEINDQSILLTINNLDPDILLPEVELNSTIDGDISNTFIDIKSNVAIASAITSYARIHMMQFKTGSFQDQIAYTDTDSIFLTQPLPESLVGQELGLMKDELDGK